MRRIEALILVLGIAAAMPRVATAQTPLPPAPCTATQANPVAICFGTPALVMDHCNAKLIPNFTFAIWNAPNRPTVGYRYSYQVSYNGTPQLPIHRIGDPDQFPFDGPPDLTGQSVTYAGAGRYDLRVTVYPEGQQKPEFRNSDGFAVTDRPRVRGIVIGVSNYTNDAYDLNYPDADARTFHTALTGLLGPTTDIALDLYTSDENADLDGTGLVQAIRTAAANQGADGRMCGAQDWFVFYYSGHGVVAAHRHNNTVGRYISTASFDAANLEETALRIPSLATELGDTGAKNVLVILDSCFSGRYTSSRHTLAPAPRDGRALPLSLADSPKVLYVADGAAVLHPLAGKGDSLSFSNKLLEFDEDGRHGLVLSAAKADQQAEEGPARYARGPGGQLWLEFERRSVTSNRTEKREGFGLFTFAWLANLLSQVPKAIDTGVWLRTGMPPLDISSGECSLDFEGAAIKAQGDISTLAKRRSLDMQQPDIARTKSLQGLPCGAQGQGDAP